MTGIYSGQRRLFYPVASKWRFGDPGDAKLIRKIAGHSDMATAMRSSEQCVLRILMGIDSNSLIPMYSSERAYNDKAMRQFRTEQRELEESIKKATEVSEYDLARNYKKELKKLKKTLRKWTKGDLITRNKSRPLNAGDPIKPITHCLRQRKLRVVNGLIQNGFEDEAADLNRCYVVADKSVVFYQCESEYQWILTPEK